MNIMFWDLGLLVLFVLFSSIFLYKNKKRIKRDGILWLYPTKWGVKLIEKIGKKHRKTLLVLSHISVWVGYILMAVMVYMFAKIVYVYAFHSSALASVKLPPIAPLIPYLPQIFGLNWLPPFYFSYWILILAIIAITHEFFHGIFAAAAKVKTKSTGFGFFPYFLPVIPLAFVNLDEKKMDKTKNFSQRAVLSAGTFANILTTLLSILLMWGFFTIAFSPAGVVYNDYAYNVVGLNTITVNGVPISQINNTQNLSKNSIVSGNTTYYALKAISGNQAALYYDSPAIESNLTGAIMKINGEKITSLNKLSRTLSNYDPGQTISVTTFDGKNTNTLNITLSSSPDNPSKAWLGVSFVSGSPSGIINKISYFFSSFKDKNVYYTPNFSGANFIYNFLWWLMLISLSVALINMLPMGIFDGGRFFYLTILKFTKSKKAAEKSFKWITNILLFLVLVMMFFWAKNLF